MAHTLTVDIPASLFTQLQKRAEKTKRSVEIELVELLAANVPTSDEHPDLATALGALDAAALTRAAQSRLGAELSAELEALHLKQQREGLNDAESQRTAELVRAYERCLARLRAGGRHYRTARR